LFLDRSDLIVHNPALLGYGVCVTDLDDDGAFEFFVAGFDCANVVLKWNGSGYEARPHHTLAAPNRQAIGVAAADIDGDGREELYVLNTDTFAGAKRFGDQLFAFRDGAWCDLFTLDENVGLVNQVAGRSVAALDRRGRGRYGFFVANYGGPMRLYENLTGTRLKDAAPDANVDFVTGGRALVALPLVSPPGRMDVFAANENGPNYLFQNLGDGTFDEVAAELSLHDPFENGRGVAVLDADENGRFDLCVGNWQGEHRLFLQSPLGGFLDVAPPEMNRPSAIRTVLAADFDNDGYEEIFFNNIGEPNRLFAYRDGRWTRADIGDADEPDGLGTGAAIADLDNDGRLELLIAHGEQDPQPLSLYQTAPNDNDWLRILPLTPFGAPARGAVVTLTTRTRVQRRAIDAGSGYLCQMEPVAHFGLGAARGAADPVEQVEIVWPGGARAVIESPPVRDTLRVPHPA